MIGFITEDVGTLQQELIGWVDNLGRKLIGKVNDLFHDVGVLRGHFVDLQNEVVAL